MRKHVVVSKDQETVKIANLPDAPGYRAWKMSTFMEVFSAVGGRDCIIDYMKMVENSTISHDMLRPSETFFRVEMSLANNLLKVATGELGRRMYTLQEEKFKKGEVVGGRQLMSPSTSGS